MKVCRVLLLLSVCLCSGCLLTFKHGIAPGEAAPEYLLGLWSRSNEYGEEQYLQISRSADRYRLLSYIDDQTNQDGAEEFLFTVSRQGQRWYLSTELPKSAGGNYLMAGFDITDQDELVVYSLDVETILQDIGAGVLQGQQVDTEQGSGALVTSPLSQVLAYLNDPDHADVFTEALRFSRVPKNTKPEGDQDD